MQEEYPMQFRFRCAAVLTAVLLCSAAALPALAEETATPETADSASTYTGWKTVNGKDYWYENGVKQGTTGRGKEIYDPDSDAWYWLDADQGGAKAVSKDVYQESNGGKWVRYDANGHMIKGWDTNDDGTYYFDLVTGAMAKGDIVVDNLPCSFDTTTGIGCNLMWHSMDGKDYWYEAGKRQGYDPNNAAYRGKEIYDPASDAWYWLDNVQQGAKTVSKDVYQESEAGDWAENADGTGKWVRYDANGHMVKGWDTNNDGTYYFDQVYGTMAKGIVTIDGNLYLFDVDTGVMQASITTSEEAMADRVIELVNQERTSRGLQPQDEAAMVGYLYLFIAALMKETIAGKPHSTSSSSQYVLNAIKYIQFNYSHDISIDDVAKSVGVSRSHLYRVFMLNVGKSPIDYLTEYRVNEACKLLRAGHLSIAEVAVSVGFFDQFYFSRVFKRAKGVPPSKYFAAQQDADPASPAQL